MYRYFMWKFLFFGRKRKTIRIPVFHIIFACVLHCHMKNSKLVCLTNRRLGFIKFQKSKFIYTFEPTLVEFLEVSIHLLDEILRFDSFGLKFTLLLENSLFDCYILLYNYYFLFGVVYFQHIYFFWQSNFEINFI